MQINLQKQKEIAVEKKNSDVSHQLGSSSKYLLNVKGQKLTSKKRLRSIQPSTGSVLNEVSVVHLPLEVICVCVEKDNL